jgi:hypothetical protein
MPRPSTLAALAVVICVPALVVFSSGNLSVYGLLTRYLVALVIVSGGTSVLARLWRSYTSQDDSSPDRTDDSRRSADR